MRDKNILNANVGIKLAFGFAGMAILILVLAAFSIHRMDNIDGMVQSQNKLRTEKLDLLYTAKEALDKAGLAAHNAYFFANDVDAERELDLLDRQRVIYLEALNTMIPAFVGDSQFETAKNDLLEMADELTRPRGYRSAGKMTEFREFLVKEYSPLHLQTIFVIDLLQKSIQHTINTQNYQAREESGQAITIIFLLAIMAILVGAGVIFFINHRLQNQSGTGSADENGRSNNDDLAKLGVKKENLLAMIDEMRTGTKSIIKASIKISSGNFELSNELQTSFHSGVKGGEVMTEVINKMGAINESAHKLVDIIGVVDELAFQIDTLTQEATLEAIRADEEDKRLAAVTLKVCHSAQRMAYLVKEIESLILDSVDQISSGGRQASEASSKMVEIVGSVNRVADIMADILTVSQEQITGLEQINQAIEEMDQFTQRNVFMEDR